MRHPKIHPKGWALGLCLRVGLEGCTGGVTRGGRVGRAYGDLTGGATRLAVVVDAVLDVTANTLDVTAAFLIVVHVYTILLASATCRCHLK